MKLAKIYSGLLNEQTVEACVAKFGQELFSPQMGGTEPNTPTEDRYVELLTQYAGNSELVKSEFINMATDLKRCVSKYPDILHNGKGYIYKGNKMTIEDMLDSYGDIGNALRVGQPFNLVFASKNPIQSWSDDEDFALDDFGQAGPKLNKLLDKFELAKKNNDVKHFVDHVIENGLDIGVPLLLKFRPSPDDLLFKGKFFNYISRQEENEILRLDNRPVKVMAKVYPSKLSAQLFELLELINSRSNNESIY